MGFDYGIVRVALFFPLCPARPTYYSLSSIVSLLATGTKMFRDPTCFDKPRQGNSSKQVFIDKNHRITSRTREMWALLGRIFCSSLITQFLTWVWSKLQQLMRGGGKIITMDTGIQVGLGKQIAEGGFSYVFAAVDSDDPKKLYAVKQIRCFDADMIRIARKEASVHRAVDHPNCMPLLGFTIEEKTVCYMLFPRMSHSLRDEVNGRVWGPAARNNNDNSNNNAAAVAPWDELEALKVFLGIARGVQALHSITYSHRDVKLENVMFHQRPRNQRKSQLAQQPLQTPVLMDFGSVGALQEPISTRRQVMNIVEDSAMHTTLPYRPPELFEGGVRAGDNADDNMLDFRLVDVWSLGCTLFAILYGASPFESEFSRATGTLKVVECSHLRVLGDVPAPPPHSPTSTWYTSDTQGLYSKMLNRDRKQRPTLDAVIEDVTRVIQQLGGHLPVSAQKSLNIEVIDEDEDEFGSLLSTNNRNFV